MGKKNKTKISPIGKPLKHVLSHQDLFTNFYVVEVKKLPTLGDAIPVNIADLDNYGLPRVITLFLENNPI